MHPLPLTVPPPAPPPPPVPARPAPLPAGRAGLREQSLADAASGRRRGDTGERVLPVLPALRGLLPDGGLRRGSTVTVTGSASLLLAVLAGPSLAGAWCAVVGMASLGVVAAVEAGVSPARLVLAAFPGPQWPLVTAALLDALDVVVVSPPGRVRDADARRLAARARERGAVLVPLVPWAGADVRLSVAERRWEGLGDGHGYLRACQAVVRAEGRGAASRPRQAQLWLPATGATVGPLERTGSCAGTGPLDGTSVASPPAPASGPGTGRGQGSRPTAESGAGDTPGGHGRNGGRVVRLPGRGVA
jgi:hypothetical protein